MKVTFEIEVNFDGELPAKDLIEAGLWKLAPEACYIGSEEVDGTDEWGIEVVSVQMTVAQESEAKNGQV
jgi:hypothetical protein